MTNLLKFTDGEVLHYDHKTATATAVNREDNKLLTFYGYEFYSGWPVCSPKKGDKITIRWSLDGKFLCARLADD